MLWYNIYFLFPSYQVIKDHADLIDIKRVFFSEIRDDNPLDCLVQKLNIARLPHDVCFLILVSMLECVFLDNQIISIKWIYFWSLLQLDSEARKLAISSCDYYYDMLYLLDYSSFIKLPSGI